MIPAWAVLGIKIIIFNRKLITVIFGFESARLQTSWKLIIEIKSQIYRYHLVFELS